MIVVKLIYLLPHADEVEVAVIMSINVEMGSIFEALKKE